VSFVSNQRTAAVQSIELLLLDASNYGTGIVREPTVRGTSAVESRYH
jgi:hypothetical protein